MIDTFPPISANVHTRPGKLPQNPDRRPYLGFLLSCHLLYVAHTFAPFCSGLIVWDIIQLADNKRCILFSPDCIKATWNWLRANGRKGYVVTKSEHCMLFSHFWVFFPSPYSGWFHYCYRTVWSRTALHTPQCLPCLCRTCGGDWRAHTNKSPAHIQKSHTRAQTQRKKKSYSTPYINSGLDKHNRHKRVTPWK